MTNLLIPVGEESLENFTAGDDGMPAHPGHPALQPLHAHLDKLFLKSSWNGREKKKKLSALFIFICILHLSWLTHNYKCLPVTCLSGKEGMGMADPNLSSSLSYSQSKCLYLWLTGRFVVCKPITWQRFPTCCTFFICCKLEYKVKFHDIFGMSVCTHAGCDLVFDVAFEAIHLWAFFGICHHAV